MVYVYDCLIQFYQFFIELCYFNKKEIFKLIALNSLNCVENCISYKSRNPPQTVNQIAVILESITIKKSEMLWITLCYNLKTLIYLSYCIFGNIYQVQCKKSCLCKTKTKGQKFVNTMTPC